MQFGLDDAPLAVWNIQHLPVRLLEWKPQKASITLFVRHPGTFTVMHKRMSRVIPCLPVLMGTE